MPHESAAPFPTPSSPASLKDMMFPLYPFLPHLSLFASLPPSFLPEVVLIEYTKQKCMAEPMLRDFIADGYMPPRCSVVVKGGGHCRHELQASLENRQRGL